MHMDFIKKNKEKTYKRAVEFPWGLCKNEVFYV